jgi:glutamate dehydrogenase/leucine dehydrogenase
LRLRSHDTTLGPAGGGIRIWQYETEADAIKDALRLARGMTYKWAAAGANLGGGKCVVIGDPKRDKTEGLFRVLGRFMHRLGGLFLAGPDVGTNLRDMEIIRMETPYVVTIPESWGGPGDSSPATAFGVMQGMRACLKEAATVFKNVFKCMHSLYNKAEFGHKNRPGSFYRLHRLLSVLRKEQLVNSRTLAKTPVG